MHTLAIDRVVDLTDPARYLIYNMSLEEARQRLATGHEELVQLGRRRRAARGGAPEYLGERECLADQVGEGGVGKLDVELLR